MWNQQEEQEDFKDASEETHSAPDLSRQVSINDFQCGCCYDLLIQPTSLTCGHSFCRLCLANWFLASKKTECPTCKQRWQGCPKINITMRNLIEKTFGSQMHERETTWLTPENQKKIEQFDKSLTGVAARGAVPGVAGQQVPARNPRQAKDFCSGLLVAIVVLIVIYLAIYWKNSDKQLLVYKPVERWDVDDVCQWIEELGSWSEHYRQRAQQEKIDGRMLMVMDESDIKQKLNVTDSIHMKVILHTIQDLIASGTKQPGNLWEFKSTHPGTTLFLLYGLKDCPRTTALYLYFFKYDTVFIPLVHRSCPRTQDTENFNDTSSLFDNLSTEQMIEFVSKWLFLPYYVVAGYAYDWTTSHYWVSRVILLNCLALTFLEVEAFTKYFRGGYRNSKNLAQKFGKELLSLLFFMIIWPIVPSLICDCFFYIALYFSPAYHYQKLYKSWKLNQRNN